MGQKMFKRIRNRYQYSNTWKRQGVLKTAKQPAEVFTRTEKNMQSKFAAPEINLVKR
jgi:hypothetical protein